jgi:hypothetical protein
MVYTLYNNTHTTIYNEDDSRSHEFFVIYQCVLQWMISLMEHPFVSKAMSYAKLIVEQQFELLDRPLPEGITSLIAYNGTAKVSIFAELIGFALTMLDPILLELSVEYDKCMSDPSRYANYNNLFMNSIVELCDTPMDVYLESLPDCIRNTVTVEHEKFKQSYYSKFNAKQRCEHDESLKLEPIQRQVLIVSLVKIVFKYMIYNMHKISVLTEEKDKNIFNHRIDKKTKSTTLEKYYLYIANRSIKSLYLYLFENNVHINSPAANAIFSSISISLNYTELSFTRTVLNKKYTELSPLLNVLFRAFGKVYHVLSNTVKCKYSHKLPTLGRIVQYRDQFMYDSMIGMSSLELIHSDIFYLPFDVPEFVDYVKLVRRAFSPEKLEMMQYIIVPNIDTEFAEGFDDFYTKTTIQSKSKKKRQVKHVVYTDPVADIQNIAKMFLIYDARYKLPKIQELDDRNITYFTIINEMIATCPRKDMDGFSEQCDIFEAAKDDWMSYVYFHVDISHVDFDYIFGMLYGLILKECISVRIIPSYPDEDGNPTTIRSPTVNVIRFITDHTYRIDIM